MHRQYKYLTHCGDEIPQWVVDAAKLAATRVTLDAPTAKRDGTLVLAVRGRMLVLQVIDLEDAHLPARPTA